METEMQKFERLCEQSGIRTVSLQYNGPRIDQLFKFFKNVVVDCTGQKPQPTHPPTTLEQDLLEAFKKRNIKIRELKVEKGASKYTIYRDIPTQPSKTQQLILKTLKRRKKNGMSADELSSLTDISISSIHKNTLTLQRMGLLKEGKPRGRSKTWLPQGEMK